MAKIVTPPVHASPPPVPRWVRARSETFGDAAFAVGGALATLDSRVRAEAPFAGVWRRRLALRAASDSARDVRRAEDEAQLRDAFFLRSQSTDDPGPGGRLLVAWRALDRSAALSDEAVAHVIAQLDLKLDDALRGALAAGQAAVSSRRAALSAAATAAAVILAARPDAAVLAWWMADAVLAACLKWPMPLPLLVTGLRLLSPRPPVGGEVWERACCEAYAAASLHACDLYADLAWRSGRLLAVAPRLRAKGSKAVVQQLLDDDVVPATRKFAAISDRGMRRLFDRLVALDAVRELTGRPTFRLYGL